MSALRKSVSVKIPQSSFDLNEIAERSQPLRVENVRRLHPSDYVLVRHLVDRETFQLFGDIEIESKLWEQDRKTESLRCGYVSSVLGIYVT